MRQAQDLRAIRVQSNDHYKRSLIAVFITTILFSCLWAKAVEIIEPHKKIGEFPYGYRHALDSVNQPERAPASDAIDFLAKNPSQEALIAIRARLEFEVNSVDPRDPDPLSIRVIRSALLALLQIGDQSDKDLIIQQKNELDLKGFFSTTNAAVAALETTFMDTILGLGRNNEPRVNLPSFAEAIAQTLLPGSEDGTSHRNDQLSQEFLRPVKKLEEFMRERVIEQGEAINAFVTLTLRDQLFPAMQRPEIFYLMGLPGNGKDTLAETYVDALWGYDGAHKEHLFEITATNKAEIWALLGSANGYVDSDKVGSLIEYLVEHSGGRYKIITVNDGHRDRQIVVYNREFDPTHSIASLPPVIVINEAHDIPKAVKENLLKKPMQTGRFPINNVGNHPDAVRQIEIPRIRFIFLSNEGAELLEPVASNGTRLGPPLSYEDLESNHRRVARDKTVLRNALLKTNGGKKTTRVDPDAPGNSQAFVNRIPSNRLILLEPLSPKGLLKLINKQLKKELDPLRSSPAFQFGPLDLSISEEVAKFILEYDYIAADNARPIEHKIWSLFLNTFLESIRTGKIYPDMRGQKVSVGLRQYDNGVSALLFEVTRSDGSTYKFTRMMRETLGKKILKSIPDARVTEILGMAESMKANVFGIDHIIDRLIDRILVAEGSTYGLPDTEEHARRAVLMAFLGLTSTGKTETAKQLAVARFGNEAALKVIDFNGIRSVKDMREKIFGSEDMHGEPVPSEFMKHYDLANGRGVVYVFDEIANTDPVLLMELFEMFREKTVRGFVDGQARNMTRVTIILTGNAGKEIYDDLPANLAPDVRERAMQSIYSDFVQNPDRQYQILKKFFPEPLIARIGLPNIFFFRPHTYTSKRQLTLHKLMAGLESLKPRLGKRGWFVEFESQVDFLNLVEMIEQEGFQTEEQGASIDKYVKEEVIDVIEGRLYRQNVPSRSHVTIKLSPGEVAKMDRDIERRHRELVVTPDKGSPFTINLYAKPARVELVTPPIQTTLVAYHEAGHEIARRALFGDQTSSTFLTIREGVTDTGSGYMLYQGLSVAENRHTPWLTREVVLRQVAVLTAGYVAEELATLGHRSSSGKQNDMQRSTDLIYRAILVFGLSPNWGTRSIPTGMTVSDYMEKHLTDAERSEVNHEVRLWLAESENLVRRILIANFNNALKPLALILADKGTLQKDDIELFYKEHNLLSENDRYFHHQMERIHSLQNKLARAVKLATQFKAIDLKAELMKLSSPPKVQEFSQMYGRLRFFNWSLPSWRSMSHKQHLELASMLSSHLSDLRRDAEILAEELFPKSLVDWKAVAHREKESEVSQVPLPKIPLVQSLHLSSGHDLCRAVFSQ